MFDPEAIIAFFGKPKPNPKPNPKPKPKPKPEQEDDCELPWLC